ncbi:TPA: hypothetical protein ACRGEA_005330, partial [Klebsiella pneumoniae]
INKGKKKEGVQNILDVPLHRKEISSTYFYSPFLVTLASFNSIYKAIPAIFSFNCIGDIRTWDYNNTFCMVLFGFS